MTLEALTDRIRQIDCNNPAIDRSVITRYITNNATLEVIGTVKELMADETDEVPFGCPLTQEPVQIERAPDDFARACSDCPHAFVSMLPGIIETS